MHEYLLFRKLDRTLADCSSWRCGRCNGDGGRK